MRPWLQDPDGDGTYTWSTDQIPAGSHEFKVAHKLSRGVGVKNLWGKTDPTPRGLRQVGCSFRSGSAAAQRQKTIGSRRHAEAGVLSLSSKINLLIRRNVFGEMPYNKYPVRYWLRHSLRQSP